VPPELAFARQLGVRVMRPLVGDVHVVRAVAHQGGDIPAHGARRAPHAPPGGACGAGGRSRRTLQEGHQCPDVFRPTGAGPCSCHRLSRSRSARVGISPAGAQRREGTAGSSPASSTAPVRMALMPTATAMPMTMAVSTTKMIDSVPCTAVLRMTASTTSGLPRLPSAAACAARYLALLAQYPMPGTGEKILYSEAVTVITAVNASGIPMIHSQRTYDGPRLATMANTTASAMPASSWLAMPNSGKKVLMPPSGSVTPRMRMYPQP